MVSIRRRRYLGHCSGRSSSPVFLPKPIKNVNAVDNPNRSVSVHPMPSVDTRLQKMRLARFIFGYFPELFHAYYNVFKESKCETCPGSSNAFSSIIPKEEPNDYCPGNEIKRRKWHKRKHYRDQNPCIMRGVYFKNMKWQAAIKVDRKQIHLGTVGSQKEAARLYDRAAFMCGRETNFELTEGEQQELKQYDWEEFLSLTRSAINNKKHQRKLISAGRQKRDPRSPNGNLEHEEANSESSMSEYEEVGAEASVL